MAGTFARSRSLAVATQTRDYFEPLAAIRQSIGGTQVEMFGRFLLPALGIGMIAALLADMTIVMLYMIYGTAQIVMFGFLHSRSSPASRTEYLFALGLCVLSSCSFMIIAIYMWSTGSLLAQFASCLMALGFAIYGLTRNGAVFALLVIDGVPIAVCALYSTWFMSNLLADKVHPVVPLAMGLLVVAYYFVSLYDVFVTRRELKIARDRAVSAERLQAVGHLTAGVAHDFNNILTAVLGHLDLYGHLSHPVEKDNCVTEAHNAATRAARLTAQLLFFARKARLSAKPTDLAECLAGFSERARDLLPDSIDLHVNLPPGLPSVMVDPDQLLTVLLQLILNARDGLGAAGELTLGLEPLYLSKSQRMQAGNELAQGAYCVIRIDDNGAGIHPDHLTHIFEPFYPTRARGQTSGLGLPMAAGFAEQSGGAISIFSKLGCGTTVSLVLPVISTPQ